MLFTSPRVSRIKLTNRYNLPSADKKLGAVAQLGERGVRNDEVGGSNPPSSTIKDIYKN